MTNSTTTVTPNPIPTPYTSEREHERFLHRDLSDLTAEEAWAESNVLVWWLSVATFQRIRPRYIDDTISDQDWARQRLQRLRAVASRRAA